MANEKLRHRRVSITERLYLAKNAVIQVMRGNTTRTITLDEFVNAIDGTAQAEVLAAAKTLTAADTGKTFFLNLAGGFTVTLPAPAAGLRFNFIVSTAPTTAYIIAAASGADVIILETHEIAGAAGIYDNNADVVNFVASVAVVGDRLALECDGTNWFGLGTHNTDGGMTSATT